MQWGLEVLNIIVFLVYVFIVYGWSHIMDKYFNLYLVLFASVIQPAFYLNGDIHFRIDIYNHGVIVALKNVLFN